MRFAASTISIDIALCGSHSPLISLTQMNQTELLVQFDSMIDRMQKLFEESRSTMNKALETRNALVAGKQKIAEGCTVEELQPLLDIILKATRVPV